MGGWDISQSLRLKDMNDYCALDSNSASKSVTDWGRGAEGVRARRLIRFSLAFWLKHSTKRTRWCLHDYHIHPKVSSASCPSFCEQSLHTQHQSYCWTSQHKQLNLHWTEALNQRPELRISVRQQRPHLHTPHNAGRHWGINVIKAKTKH